MAWPTSTRARSNSKCSARRSSFPTSSWATCAGSSRIARNSTRISSLSLRTASLYSTWSTWWTISVRVTHVIRGEDHLSNTAKHIALFRASGAEPPRYAHIPLDPEQRRHQDEQTRQGRFAMTYLRGGLRPGGAGQLSGPAGLVPQRQPEEGVPGHEVVQSFDLPQILRHNARFDLTELHWLNGRIYPRDDRRPLLRASVQALARAGIDTDRPRCAYVKAALDTCKGKFKVFNELPPYAGFFVQGRHQILVGSRGEGVQPLRTSNRGSRGCERP